MGRIMEFIERKITSKKEPISEEYDQFQISYNSYGHLCLRWFNEENNKDFLLILTSDETAKVLRFLRILRNLE
jgi:hypothetical protein